MVISTVAKAPPSTLILNSPKFESGCKGGSIGNHSIAEGKFPESWKEGVVTTVLKKGSPTDKNNYRSVTCLSVLSKGLEKIVCTQITNYMEKRTCCHPINI